MCIRQRFLIVQVDKWITSKCTRVSRIGSACAVTIVRGVILGIHWGCEMDHGALLISVTHREATRYKVTQ